MIVQIYIIFVMDHESLDFLDDKNFTFWIWKHFFQCFFLRFTEGHQRVGLKYIEIAVLFVKSVSEAVVCEPEYGLDGVRKWEYMLLHFREQREFDGNWVGYLSAYELLFAFFQKFILLFLRHVRNL